MRKRFAWGPGSNCIKLTFYLLSAHSPNNTFLGFVVDKAVTKETDMKMEFHKETKKDKPIAVLYAKKANYLNVSVGVTDSFSLWLVSFFFTACHKFFTAGFIYLFIILFVRLTAWHVK